MKVRRHRLINAVVLPHPEQVYRPTLLRPVSLVDVFKRHPEWKRRTELVMLAKAAGERIPDFPPLAECRRCRGDYELATVPPIHLVCPACRAKPCRECGAVAVVAGRCRVHYDRWWRANRAG